MSEEINAAGKGTITIRAVKGNLFRVVHATGFLLQPSPKGETRLTVFNDRVAFDTTTTLEFSDDGGWEQLNAGSGDDIVREFERELEVEIAVPDKELLNLLQTLQSYLIFRGVLKPKTENHSDSTDD